MKPMAIAAPNGARRGKAEHKNLPITIEEIATEAAACQQAGAAVLHLHVRDSNGAHSLDSGLYRAATKAIAKAAPGLLVQHILYSVEDILWFKAFGVGKIRGRAPRGLTRLFGSAGRGSGLRITCGGKTGHWRAAPTSLWRR